ncbi:SPASM domain-containing protein [Vibrio chagasii]|nr:SPASM domain-containing protein [Vibrio chagasii]
MCTLSEICGKGLAVEPNGDVYSCDHYVCKFKLGNIHDKPLSKISVFTRPTNLWLLSKSHYLNNAKLVSLGFACHGSVKTESSPVVTVRLG